MNIGDNSDLYDVAVYLRLSRDDNDIDGSSKTESNSISSQRELIRTFVKSHSDMQIYDIYIDDGYSGSNFERPEFKRMMEDVHAGKVNCVIVKDLSRFGRDYIEAGRLIQKIFPALRVRFIAITDHYDSTTANKTDSSLILPVKNFVNDSYCRDISQKVKAHQKIKRQNGEFIGAFTVYGYEKNSNNRNQLVVDVYAADIVRKVFTWKVDGLSLGAIADKLNNLHILSPLEYKKSKGVKYCSGFQSVTESKWSAMAVKRILTNPVYIGTLVQGKQEKINYKVKKKVDKPETEWICVENTHEAIINKQDYYMVQKLLKFDGRASVETGAANLFTGILFCGDCKAPMIRRTNTYKGVSNVYYICQTKNKSLGCSRHSLKEDILKDVLLEEIKKYFAVMNRYNEVLEHLRCLEVRYEQVIEYDTQISKLQEEYNKFYALKSSLYADLKEGIINKEEFEEFHTMYGMKCDNLLKSIECQKKLIKDMFKNGITSSVLLKSMETELVIEKLTRMVLLSTVTSVHVFEDKRLCIEFRYQDVFKKLAMIDGYYQDKIPQQEVV